MSLSLVPRNHLFPSRPGWTTFHLALFNSSVALTTLQSNVISHQHPPPHSPSLRNVHYDIRLLPVSLMLRTHRLPLYSQRTYNLPNHRPMRHLVPRDAFSLSPHICSIHPPFFSLFFTTSWCAPFRSSPLTAVLLHRYLFFRLPFLCGTSSRSIPRIVFTRTPVPFHGLRHCCFFLSDSTIIPPWAITNSSPTSIVGSLPLVSSLDRRCFNFHHLFSTYSDASSCSSLPWIPILMRSKLVSMEG